MTGETKSLQGFLEEVIMLFRAWFFLDVDVDRTIVSWAICRISSTGFPIKSLLDNPENKENALFAWTTQKGGVDSVISLKKDEEMLR